MDFIYSFFCCYNNDLKDEDLSDIDSLSVTSSFSYITLKSVEENESEIKIKNLYFLNMT